MQIKDIIFMSCNLLEPECKNEASKLYEAVIKDLINKGKLL